MQAVLASNGRVAVMGMGKSGHIGRKICATLASTGTPAMFLHPAEASHGDLGMVKTVDLVLAISNSGESDELVTILPVLKRQGVPLIAKISEVRFRSPVYPGDTISIEVTEKEAMGVFTMLSGVMSNGGKKVLTLDFAVAWKVPENIKMTGDGAVPAAHG